VWPKLGQSSTELVVLINNLVTSAAFEKQQVDMILLDLTKAFERSARKKSCCKYMWTKSKVKPSCGSKIFNITDCSQLFLMAAALSQSLIQLSISAGHWLIVISDTPIWPKSGCQFFCAVISSIVSWGGWRLGLTTVQYLKSLGGVWMFEDVNFHHSKMGTNVWGQMPKAENILEFYSVYFMVE
jgi:hypothetical protein